MFLLFYKSQKFQKIIFLPVLALGFLSIAFFAHAAGNLTGYAWADSGIGWISFNCANTGVCATSNYGVTVAPSGVMLGYAWANPNDGAQNHIGWINFAPSGPYPASSFVPSQSVMMNPGTGTVRGWVRAVNYDLAGGWDGWIGFGSGGNYGSGVTVSGCSWNGYGWGGGINIGWIHFTGSTYGVTGSGDGCVASFDYSLSNSGDITVTAGSSGFNTITRTLVAGATAGVTLSVSGLPVGASVSPPITNNPCSPSPTCSSTLTIATLASTAAGTYPITVTGAPLGKTTTFNLIVNAVPPAPSGLNAIASNTCGTITLAWSDNSSNESEFRIERKLSSAPVASYVQIAAPFPNSTSFDDTTIAQNTSYDYRIYAWNILGPSAYSNTAVGNNQSPSANFSWSPVTVRPNQSVLFTDTSLAYGAGIPIATRAWTFQNGTPSVSSASSQTVSFTGTGQKSVTLRVTDSLNRICGPISKFVPLSTESGIPEWFEEPPQ